MIYLLIICYLSKGPPPILPHKQRPRSYKVGMRYNAPQHEYITAAEVTGELRGKKVKVKRRRLKSKRHTHDLIHVPVGHDILTRHEVNPYDDVSTANFHMPFMFITPHW